MKRVKFILDDLRANHIAYKRNLVKLMRAYMEGDKKGLKCYREKERVLDRRSKEILVTLKVAKILGKEDRR